MQNWGSWAPKSDPQTAITFADKDELKQILKSRCAALENRIAGCAAPEFSTSPLGFERLHKFMFAGLVPTLPAAVGIFRGTPGSCLEFAERVVRNDGLLLGLESYDGCVLAKDVAAQMARFQRDFETFWNQNERGNFQEIIANLTFRFFHIHPFLDGNGHVWRASALILARRYGVETTPDWGIDAKNYGPEMSLALQRYPAERSELEGLLGRILLA